MSLSSQLVAEPTRLRDLLQVLLDDLRDVDLCRFYLRMEQSARGPNGRKVGGGIKCTHRMAHRLKMVAVCPVCAQSG
jgi:hypothetical protein